MGIFSATLIGALSVVLFPHYAYSQKAEAPIYKDGNWWRVRVEYEHKEGFDRSPLCHEEYDEYFVEIKQGEPNVYGIADKKKEAIDCPIITEQLLNYPPKNRMFLKFPLTLKKSWSHRYQNRQGRWRDSAMEVVAWEKVGTSKGEFDTFKIERSRGRRGVSRFYYYSPKARAIVLHKVDSRTVRRKVTLIDFKVR